MFSVKTAFIGLKGKRSRDLIVSLDLLEGKEMEKKTTQFEGRRVEK